MDTNDYYSIHYVQYSNNKTITVKLIHRQPEGGNRIETLDIQGMDLVSCMTLIEDVIKFTTGREFGYTPRILHNQPLIGGGFSTIHTFIEE